MEKKQKNNQKRKNPQKKEDNSIISDFDLEVYPEHIIREAVKDYKKVADINLTFKNNKIIAKITPRENIKNIRGEFSNYVLALMINQNE